MTLIGFKRATIQILDESLAPVAEKKFVIEGTTNKGATSAFEVTGLSPEAVKVYGSNIPYYVSQKGTGDLAATFSALDLPAEVENAVLGRDGEEDGVTHIGDDTIAPYCAVLFESGNLKGEKVGIGFYAGKFGRDSIKAETTTGSAIEPEADEYTFTPISKNIDGKSQAIGFAYNNTAFTKLETEVFGTTTVEP